MILEAFYDELEKISRAIGGMRGAPAWGGSARLAATDAFASRSANSAGNMGLRPTTRGVKERNMIAPQIQLPPVKVAKPPTPNPTPGD
jgi:hypothetical protein